MSAWPTVCTVTATPHGHATAAEPAAPVVPASLDTLSPRMCRAAWTAVADYLRGTSTARDAIPAATRRALAARGLIWTNDCAPIVGPTRALLDLAGEQARERLTAGRVDAVRERATAYELPQTVGIEVTATANATGAYFDVCHWAAHAFDPGHVPPGTLGPFLTVLPATWWRGVGGGEG